MRRDDQPLCSALTGDRRRFSKENARTVNRAGKTENARIQFLLASGGAALCDPIYIRTLSRAEAQRSERKKSIDRGGRRKRARC